MCGNRNVDWDFLKNVPCVICSEAFPDQKLLVDGMHACPELEKVNLERVKDGESQVSIFEDIGSGEVNIKVGIEFVVAQYCPFCGKSFKENTDES